jgi:hypothetical protein
MKTLRTLTRGSAVVLLTTLGLSAQAGTLINNFTTPFDYVANGIIGDTNWDGVYLNIGDVPNGGPPGNGGGATLIANSGITYPGYLGVRSSGTEWSGANDDGFYLWKLVSGDFDVSVQSSPFDLNGGVTFDNGAYNFAGLMVRAWNTNLSGAPVSFTLTNSAENFLLNWRFQEFGINELRVSTNGNNLEPTYPDSSTDTATTRYFRITRTGNTFQFYWKTNQTDSWVLITNASLAPGSGYDPTNGSITRPDWNGQPVQVGIAQADFNTVTHDAVFTDFELSGPNVTFPALPAAPAALVTTATNAGGSLTFSWTLGHAGDNSLVIMRAGGNFQGSPIQGQVYRADAAFGDPATLLSVDGHYVVYNGTGTSVTVTNLAGLNTLYWVAVYEYTNPAVPVYNTASPATNIFSGPGVITGVIASIAPTNLPVGGAALGKLFASFSTGGGLVDESAGAAWSSSDPTIAAFLNGSTLSALATGSVTVTGVFQGFTATQVINTYAPAFTDNFGAYHDYVANGLQGSTWDGLFLNYGDVPGANSGPDNAKGSCSQFIANTNVLYVEAAGSSWYGAGNDGPFLFKNITGDFQASVHVGPMSTINNCDGGIMARLFDNSGGASQGGGGGAGGTETHINWVKIQNGQVAVQLTQDSGDTTIVNGLNTTDGWLLMQRVNSTNFYFYEGANGTNWSFATNLVVAEAANNAPMEVGLEQEMRTASDGFVPFDTVMIDAPGITPPTNPPPAASNFQVTLNGDLSMTFGWVASDGAGNPVRSGLIMRANGPITAFPTLAQAASIGGTGTPVSFGASGVDVGGGNWLTFATGNPAASTNVTCTVENLAPGVVYYAAVVTFVGSGANKSFNTVLPASGATASQTDGVLLGISIPPVPSIPMGGIGKPIVLGQFPGPIYVDISGAVTLVSSNTSIVVTTNGILTGLTNGATQVAAIYQTFTQVFNVTVRPPTFTDQFGVNHDYLSQGVAGSGWDGLYNTTGATNPIPDSPYVGVAGDGTTVADANISSNGVLTITQIGQGWENASSGGFLLYKYVPGDFQAAVHINSFDVAAYNQPGLMARAYGVDTNGNIGTPFGVVFPNSFGTNDLGEYWVDFTRFDEYGIGTYARLNLDSAVLESTQPDQGDGNFWLLIYRSQGTNFSFYKRASNADPWQNIPLLTTYQVPEFAGQPMQVGPMAGPWTFDGVTALTVQFDNFMLDSTTGSPLSITRGGANVNITWPPIPGTLQYSLGVSPASWQPVTGVTPVLTQGGYMVTLPISPEPRYFRLVQQ